MRLTINITGDGNAAVSEDPRLFMAELMRKLSTDVGEYYQERGRVTDVNGHNVGTWELTDIPGTDNDNDNEEG